MKTKEFISALAEENIVVAIREAGLKTSGEIRVFISNREVEDAVVAATEQFARLGMQQTAERNGVLLFVAPRSQAFVVIGDTAIHEKCGADFWSRLAEEMSALFRSGDYTGGLLGGIKQTGEIVARHFTMRPDDRNELPNNVEWG